MSHVHDIVEDVLQDGQLNGLWQDLVNFVAPRLFDVFFFDVPRTSHNHWLGHVLRSIKVSDLFRRFKAVHDWHADVRQYQAIDVLPILQGVFDFLQSF